MASLQKLFQPLLSSFIQRRYLTSASGPLFQLPAQMDRLITLYVFSPVKVSVLVQFSKPSLGTRENSLIAIRSNWQTCD